MRHRTRNGKPTSGPAENFYCRYGGHYVIPLDFENYPGNKGLCMGCAFEVYDILRTTVYVPELTVAERQKAWRQWHNSRTMTTAKERFKQGSNDAGWIYYVAQDDLIKIGYTKDVNKRIRAYGPTARLMAVHPGTLTLERDMHVKFASDLDSGREWFQRSEELMAHIVSIVERFGQPSVFEYQWTKPRTQEEKVRAMFATREFPGIADGAHSAR